MPIELRNVYSTRNLGDAAIYAALASMAPDQRAVSSLEEVNPTRVRGFSGGAGHDRAHVAVGVGGDIFNNSRPALVTRKFLSLAQELAGRDIPTFVFGQSLPPSCRGLAARYLAHVLNRLFNVTVRDESSVRRLRALGVKAHLSFDTAFVLTPDANHLEAAQKLLDENGLVAERTAVISLRGGSPHYGAVDEAITAELSHVIRQLAGRGHQVALLLQSDCSDADSDHHMAQRLAAAHPFVRVLDPLGWPDTDIEQWQLLQAILAQVNIAVAVRYHTAILRLAAGKVPY
ncbi:MAG: polysaccharide pyruvyl transferase family protein, partial [Anderseniella sp.]|nr:polysaccharide pyruvyl transferase family protein [Anderseniella sp.]